MFKEPHSNTQHLSYVLHLNSDCLHYATFVESERD